MEMHFTADSEMDAWLLRTAARQGCNPEAVVREIPKERMNYDVMFARKVEKGIAAADRGELISHEEIGH
jgi:predicted transcriptional regulator